MSSFSGEYLKRPVVDANGELFGHLADIIVETRSGEIAGILVDVVAEIDVTKLPWPTEDGFCQVPAQEIAQIGSRIMLRR